MEHIYRMTGTFLELEEILQEQFGMEDQEAARFETCLLIMDQQSVVDEINDPPMSLWYMVENEQFTAPVLKTRYSISFTDAKKKILDQIFIQFGAMLVGSDSCVFLTVLKCLLVLYRSTTYIQDNECCVYYSALKWKVTHRTQEYFRVRDIMPDNQEGVCYYLECIQDHKWNCDFCRTEMCTITEEGFSAILDTLCERKVFKKYSEIYRFDK